MAKKEKLPVEGPTVQGLSAAGPVRWEYRIVAVKKELGMRMLYDEDLNELGADGWELVQFTKDLFFFKRRRSGG